jgi:hypothetical protein
MSSLPFCVLPPGALPPGTSGPSALTPLTWTYTCAAAPVLYGVVGSTPAPALHRRLIPGIPVVTGVLIEDRDES